ncbi:MAG: aminotransferase class V-fold PLP-dependent enzyme, partial [Eubacteriales bacterium]
LVTAMEHHSNFIPWQQAVQARGAKLLLAPVLDDGRLDREAFRKLLTPEVKLVALTHASNVLGTINPVAELIREAHAAGAHCVHMRKLSMRWCAHLGEPCNRTRGLLGLSGQGEPCCC